MVFSNGLVESERKFPKIFSQIIRETRMEKRQLGQIVEWELVRLVGEQHRETVF